VDEWQGGLGPGGAAPIGPTVRARRRSAADRRAGCLAPALGGPAERQRGEKGTAVRVCARAAWSVGLTGGVGSRRQRVAGRRMTRTRGPRPTRLEDTKHGGICRADSARGGRDGLRQRVRAAHDFE